MSDRKLFVWLGLLLIFPVCLAVFAGDKFRYPCQNPINWDKEMCKMPTCDVTRTCPEHIFKGQRDPRLGPPKEGETSTTALKMSQQQTGVNCK